MFLSNKFSRVFGFVAHYEFPAFLQRRINMFYVNLLDVDLSGFDDVCTYKSLNALFTRKLKSKRDIDMDESSLISPSDGIVVESGKIRDGMALQIKGMSYRVADLIGENADLEGSSFANLYLSPRDYHRFHSPCDLEVLEVRYIDGRLLPVNRRSLLKNRYLFLLNERVVLKVRFQRSGKVAYYVAVGALNVGKITIGFEPRVRSNAHLGSKTYTYNTPVQLKKGDEIGLFEMGSTVVLIFEGDIVVNNGDTIHVGQRLANI